VKSEHSGKVPATRGLIQPHPLSGFDTVYRAEAFSLKNALGEESTFAAAD